MKTLVQKRKSKPVKETYRSHIAKNEIPYQNRIIIGIPLTGVIRAEWMLARYGQIIPTNWSSLDVLKWIDTYSPMGFMVADARNAVCRQVIEKDSEWLLFIDHDVIIPPDILDHSFEVAMKVGSP